MNTQIKLKNDARIALKQGVDLVANTVKVSLGAEGKNVVIPSPHNQGYIITKDGVTIAKSINPKNVYTAIGAALIKEAAGRTNLEAGDGTTTATVLAQSIFSGGLKLLDSGISAVELKRGIDSASRDVVKYLEKISKKVTKKNLKNIATISANGDQELGELISKAFNKIGEHGKVITENSDTYDTYIDLKDGVILERGWTSSIFKTDVIKDVCILEKPFVMLHRGKIEKGDDIVDLFDQVFSHPDGFLLIITDDIDPFIHSVIAQNVIKGAIRHKICVVKMPQILKIQKDLLNDLAILTGATIVSDDFGTKISLENLGRVKKCIVNEKEAIIVGDNDSLIDVVKEIEEKIKITNNKFEKEELQERLARITGGVATLYVGAKTDSELIEKKARIEDSINATRSALEEGTVPGGGIALCNAARRFIDKDLKGYLWEEKKKIFWFIDYYVHYIFKDGKINKHIKLFKYPKISKPTISHFKIGYQLLIASCYSPAIQICENAELEAVTDIFNKGINVKTGEEVDMFQTGIIDPTKVVRCALENAASVAGLFLTTEGVVARIK